MVANAVPGFRGAAGGREGGPGAQAESTGREHRRPLRAKERGAGRACRPCFLSGAQCGATGDGRSRSGACIDPGMRGRRGGGRGRNKGASDGRPRWSAFPSPWAERGARKPTPRPQGKEEQEAGGRERLRRRREEKASAKGDESGRITVFLFSPCCCWPSRSLLLPFRSTCARVLPALCGAGWSPCCCSRCDLALGAVPSPFRLHCCCTQIASSLLRRPSATHTHSPPPPPDLHPLPPSPAGAIFVPYKYIALVSLVALRRLPCAAPSASRAEPRALPAHRSC